MHAPRLSAIAAVFPVLVLHLFAADGLSAAETTALVPAARARIQQQGNLQGNGGFSFWTRGVLGDWFVAPQAGKVTLDVTAWGRPFAGHGPIAAVDVIPLAGPPREVGRIEVKGGGYHSYSLEFNVPKGFFTLRLRHTNRVAQEHPEELRHMVVTGMTVHGAGLAPCGPQAYAFFGPGSGPKPAGPSAAAVPLVAGGIRFWSDPARATWSVEDPASGARIESVHPVFGIAGLPVDLSTYAEQTATEDVTDDRFGECTRIRTAYRKPGALAVDQTLLVSHSGRFVVVQVDFVNETGHDLVISEVAPVVADAVRLGGSNSTWRAETDGKRFCDPYRVTTVSGAGQFEGWWELCARNKSAGSAVLFGSLTNNKGIGRVLMMPDGGGAMKVAAWSDYEAVTMRAGSRITGEPFLVALGSTGLDCLSRFGSLVAAANGVHLMRDHPINPYDPTLLALFDDFGSYGAGVIKGFHYHYDRSKGDRAFMDPAWSRANSAMVGKLGLRDYGYSPPHKRPIRGTPAPLARRYGNPDFWFKEARELAAAHPEFYVDGNVDFSNPAVIAFEKRRAERAFADKDALIVYGVDFTDLWRKLPGQHDPTQTSAQTWHTAMGIWRALANAHAAGAYGRIYMNIIGFNYGVEDILRIGNDSDQGFYGRGCTFEDGLVRQASGRWFYNGKVWWNNPDSFHVYAGGIYSYRQAKVHASFCAMAGNVVTVAEPFTNEKIPPDRLDIIRRVAPTTPDTAEAVDMFEHDPARLWNMPIRRPFGKWNVVGLFNFNYGQTGKPITQRIDFADLGLDPGKEYLVYAFWRDEFLGSLKGGFTQTLAAPDCEVYCIVQKQDHPVLVSTNRCVRQMTYDLLDMRWDAQGRTLSGRSHLTAGDPYELRVYVPEGFRLEAARAGDLPVSHSSARRLLKVDFTSPANADVDWSLRFE